MGSSAMVLQERDIAVMTTIAAWGGILADRHLRAMHFAGVGERTVRARLEKLIKNKFIERVEPPQRPALPCTVFVLGEQGRVYLNRRSPNWNNGPHDLAVNDVRFAVQSATAAPGLQLITWLNSDSFEREPRPDAFFAFDTDGDPHRRRYLLELDRGTESLKRIEREKIRGLAAYVRSPEYASIAGENKGRCLVVTIGQGRMENLVATAAKSGDKGFFYFTTLDQVKTNNILTAPIWRRATDEQLFALLLS